MANASELLKQAAKCRGLAKRAVRLASSLYNDTDRSRLLRYGRELEEQAAELERKAAALGPVVTVTLGLETPSTTLEQPPNGQAHMEKQPKH